MDRNYSWNMQQQHSSTGLTHVQSMLDYQCNDRPPSVPFYEALTGYRCFSRPAVKADVVDAKLRYESARTFDVDEDIEFNPCLTQEELNAAYAESSLSSRSNRSDVGSPPQQPTLPLPNMSFSQLTQQHHHQHHQQQQHISTSAGSGRYNSRKHRGNAVPIVNPNYGNVQQWR